MTTDQPADAGSSVPDDPEQLRQDIERTREQLGETVEALVAKTDVKAQAKEKVNNLTDRLKGTTVQATARVTQARDQLASKTSDAKQSATTNGATARDQLQARATVVGGKVRDVTPEPVQRAARHAAARTSPRQAAIVAAAAGVALLGFILIRKRRRR
jgi:phage shock protein A